MVTRTLLLFVLFLSSALAVAAEPPAPRDVDVTASDGLRLRGTFYAAGKPGPGVLLLHMCNTDRKSWAPLAPQLAAAGLNVLAVDNRGFGESGGVTNPTAEQEGGARKHWPSDFDTWFGYLLAQPGVEKDRIGIAGGSCGVNNAVQTARRHPDVKSLVLLAGGTDGDGFAFLQHNAWLPIFTAAAADDEYVADAPAMMKWVAEFTGNPRNKFMGFANGRHGTEIFPVHPELTRAITAWFVDTLITSPADRKSGVKLKHTPTSEFWSALESPGGIPKAVEIYRQSRNENPKPFLFPEGVMNIVAYGRMQAGHVQDAIELFKLNAEAYPDSANVYDSLADGYLAAALDAEKTAVAKLPGDKNNEEFKKMLRQSAEQKIQKLEAAK